MLIVPRKSRIFYSFVYAISYLLSGPTRGFDVSENCRDQAEKGCTGATMKWVCLPSLLTPLLSSAVLIFVPFVACAELHRRFSCPNMCLPSAMCFCKYVSSRGFGFRHGSWSYFTLTVAGFFYFALHVWVKLWRSCVCLYKYRLLMSAHCDFEESQCSPVSCSRYRESRSK